MSSLLSVYKPGELFLSRVRSGELMKSKSSHEFFKGLDAKGNATWGLVTEKVPVFEDPEGVLL